MVHGEIIRFAEIVLAGSCSCNTTTVNLVEMTIYSYDFYFSSLSLAHPVRD